MVSKNNKTNYALHGESTTYSSTKQKILELTLVSKKIKELKKSKYQRLRALPV